jgi:hypothetical protein
MMRGVEVFEGRERRKRYGDVWKGWEKGRDGECSTHNIPLCNKEGETGEMRKRGEEAE